MDGFYQLDIDTKWTIILLKNSNGGATSFLVEDYVHARYSGCTHVTIGVGAARFTDKDGKAHVVVNLGLEAIEEKTK
jgi:hypothetical protein